MPAEKKKKKKKDVHIFIGGEKNPSDVCDVKSVSSHYLRQQQKKGGGTHPDVTIGAAA